MKSLALIAAQKEALVSGRLYTGWLTVNKYLLLFEGIFCAGCYRLIRFFTFILV
jgi:hypothetical protein